MVGRGPGLSEFDGLGQGRRNLLLEVLRCGEPDTHGVSRATGGRIHVITSSGAEDWPEFYPGHAQPRINHLLAPASGPAGGY